MDNAKLTVDKQLFPYRGRARFTQNILSNPAKYGIKVWWVCVAEIYIHSLPKYIPEKLEQVEKSTKVIELSSLFGFQDDVTIYSYVPKKQRAVT